VFATANDSALDATVNSEVYSCTTLQN